MPTRLHTMTTNAVLFAVWFTVFALSGCAASSAQGAAQYFEGNALALASASERGDANEVRRLIKDGDPNTRSSGGETLLFQAFINGNQWKNVQQLVEAGAKVNENNLGKADTVLSWYTARGGFDAAYWLLEHGAAPTLSAPAASG